MGPPASTTSSVSPRSSSITRNSTEVPSPAGDPRVRCRRACRCADGRAAKSRALRVRAVPAPSRQGQRAETGFSEPRCDRAADPVHGRPCPCRRVPSCACISNAPSRAPGISAGAASTACASCSRGISRNSPASSCARSSESTSSRRTDRSAGCVDERVPALNGVFERPSEQLLDRAPPMSLLMASGFPTPDRAMRGPTSSPASPLLARPRGRRRPPRANTR